MAVFRTQQSGSLSPLVAEAAIEGEVRTDVDPALTTRLVIGMVNSLVEW